jgi:hypothetical protein
MSVLNRKMVLASLIKHETLTIIDIGLEKNLGVRPNEYHLKFLLDELMEGGFIETLNGVVPATYTITVNGIDEGKRLEL